MRLSRPERTPTTAFKYLESDRRISPTRAHRVPDHPPGDPGKTSGILVCLALLHFSPEGNQLRNSNFFTIRAMRTQHPGNDRSMSVSHRARRACGLIWVCNHLARW
jgi:hypothetical protein